MCFLVGSSGSIFLLLFCFFRVGDIELGWILWFVFSGFRDLWLLEGSEGCMFCFLCGFWVVVFLENIVILLDKGRGIVWWVLF